MVTNILRIVVYGFPCLVQATEREDIRPKCPARTPSGPTSVKFCASAEGLQAQS